MKYIKLFGEPQANPIKFLGGKGANLAFLTRHGFSVPPGFTVTSEAYNLWFNNVQSIGISIDELFRGVTGAGTDVSGNSQELNREKLCRISKHLRTALARLEMPVEICREINEALAGFPQATFSVRSSSTLEDMDTAAFAGQHDTYLNVEPEEVVEKVKSCFISLWEDRAVMYRLKQGFKLPEASMAVVVQQMVESRVSGVAFSINPVNGEMGEIVIDSNFGLGESVVAGEVAVDHYTVDKTSLEIMDKTIGDKEFKIVSCKKGTARIKLDSGEQESLNQEEVRKLCNTVVQIENLYGFPQDIEWAFFNDKLYILQARPITTIPPHWTRDESGERFPNAMTPLPWEFSEAGFHESLRFSLRLMGFPSFSGKWFAMFDNYIYGNQNAVKLFLSHKVIPFRNIAELRSLIPTVMDKFRWVLELPASWTRDLDRYLINIGRLKSVNLENNTVNQLWSYILNVDAMGRDYFKPNIAISITHGILHKTLFSFLQLFFEPLKAKALYDKLTRFCETKTSVVNKEIFELYTIVRSHPRLLDLLLDVDGKRIISEGLLGGYPEFKGRFARFIEDHGHRETDADPYHPTWFDAPWVVLDNISLMLKSEHVDNPFEKELAGKIEQLDAEKEVYAQIDTDFHFFFAELLRLARVYTAIDDIEHYQTTRLNMVFRKAILALGQKLEARSIVKEKADIFFASRTLLDRAILEDSPAAWSELKQLIDQNKNTYLRNKEAAPKWDLTEEMQITAGDGALHGIPGAPGIVEGEVYILRSVDDFPAFPDRAVLVARTTNPSWTPLFYSACGLITESGGPLSHGAVTAREMKIPAVMSVRGCMSLLENGQKVKIDGNRGEITII